MTTHTVNLNVGQGLSGFHRVALTDGRIILYPMSTLTKLEYVPGTDSEKVTIKMFFSDMIPYEFDNKAAADEWLHSGFRTKEEAAALGN